MTMLETRDLDAGYGQVRVLHGIDLSVREGSIAVILGANGAGKTTLLRALSGMIPAGGTIRLDGVDIRRRSVEDIVRLGVAHVVQGRGNFAELSVHENMVLGAYARRDGEVDTDLERWYDWFPRLRERRKVPAATLSGGEQQMLAIARALMARPRLLLLDEPSLGLAPIIVRELFGLLSRIEAELGMTMLVVEQNAKLALAIAADAFVLEAGRVVMAGDAATVGADANIRRAYLGY